MPAKWRRSREALRLPLFATPLTESQFRSGATVGNWHQVRQEAGLAPSPSNTSRNEARMETFFRDLRHSLRMFRQTPGFTVAAIAALTLGIGANTAIFSVVNTVLLKSVPFPDPDRIVAFTNTSPNGSGPAASPTKFNVWRQQTR